MWKQLKNAFLLLMIMTVLTGLAYPLALTGLAQVLFPFQANGSIVMKDGKPIGSLLIGQSFQKNEYFHGRPSAAGQNGYNAAASAGSNLGPTNKKLIETVAERLDNVRSANNLLPGQKVPADAVLASGSGLDPDISPDYAYLQARRVANSRGLTVDEVQRLINNHIKDRQFGILGEPRVNVLELNLALDALQR
ncbi:potassium-transporting ATPase subunit KdpC [Sporolituus thermophilus]|uniref:Potassium-transporting ATPase KdpC subunit n=1 Tax=Sporolituus thermophilus DSM 23256 TaxID=1123285 RepID=A0A1G7IM80_9FIRM|nr:potassium-transporting ATPase subunit KdpC [Sporolituus thermophilus]SDF13636.1 K+-transporting ATPase ATPase C chain [Sporolituus thermophilus DSM 23256]